jgi:hypothetical protein
MNSSWYALQILAGKVGNGRIKNVNFRYDQNEDGDPILSDLAGQHWLTEIVRELGTPITSYTGQIEDLQSYVKERKPRQIQTIIIERGKAVGVEYMI